MESKVNKLKKNKKEVKEMAEVKKKRKQQETNKAPEETKLIEQMRENPWMTSTIVLGLACLVLITMAFMEYPPGSGVPLGGDNLCSEIKATPSWFEDGVLVEEGYLNFEEMNISEVVDTLINNEITFVYHPDCGWCKKQIELFGDSWDRYVESGLTLNCE